MSFLVDTNVVSELRKRPGVVNAQVLGWAAAQPAHRLYISVVTVLEIELGILRVMRRDPAQAEMLRAWLDSAVLVGFAGRVLAVDLAVARRAARLHVPDPRPERDAYLAATALEHGFTMATRNVADFATTGVAIVDPWAGRTAGG